MGVKEYLQKLRDKKKPKPEDLGSGYAYEGAKKAEDRNKQQQEMLDEIEDKPKKKPEEDAG